MIQAEITLTAYMSGFLKVSLVGARSAIDIVAADLAVVLNIEAVQLVEPVWDRFAVPTQRNVERVVRRLVLVVGVIVGLVVATHLFLQQLGLKAVNGAEGEGVEVVE